MARSMWTILLAAALPVAAGAQDQGWAAKFFPNGLSHDFGTVAYGAQVTYKFPITNIYNVPFQVADARVGCQCTMVKKPAGTIAPRGTADLEVTMDTLKVPPGPKSVNIEITLMSAPTQPTDKLFSSKCNITVSFMSRGDITFTPAKINFGMVPVGKPVAMSLDVENRVNGNWQVLEVGKTDAPLDAVVQKLNFPGRNIHRVTVTVKPTAPAGELRHELQLKTSDGTPLSLVVEGNIQAPLVASPNVANFGATKVGEAKTRNVIVRGTGMPFKVLGVDGDGDGIKVQLPDKPAAVQVVTIQYTPDKAQELNKVLTLKTDLPGGLSTTVKVEGKAD
ncbi:MAG: DUF1573 domain-containing protein [Gemmataceae bacterium]